MKEIYSKVIQYRGDHESFGYEQGVEIKKSIMTKNRANQWKVRKQRFSINTDEAKREITAISPGVWRELLGLQQALEWSLEDTLKEFGGYRVPYLRSGCSIATGEDYLIRNYDYHPKTYEGRYTLFQPSDGGLAAAAPSQRITGRMDGINEAGLAMGYNFMNRKKPGPGFICCMIGRLILETCETVEDAVALVKRIPHRHSFSYIVYDRSGKTAIIEATPREVAVRSSIRCTNHFEQLVSENRHHLVDSSRRMDVLAQHQKERLPAKQAYTLFNAADQGLFSDLYDSWAGTIHTSVYFPKSLHAWFTLGPDQDPTVIHFEEWLRGNDLPYQQLTGMIDTDVPFLHMDDPADWFR
ncbi:C45 family autoproteolytic acyltransferase/hydrolase [Shouchella sp. JSM 1781072]|uniref:C45 family autoproteolytic acyltransferase/hydolase n=1 Tax=Shouchella sp. JSM 1781072 TaxID=3344581 RepID=UPI0035BEDF0C